MSDSYFNSYFNPNKPFPQITMTMIESGPAPLNTDDLPVLTDALSDSDWEDWAKDQTIDFVPTKTPLELMAEKAKQDTLLKAQLEDQLESAKTWNVILVIGIVAATVAGMLSGIYYQAAVGNVTYINCTPTNTQPTLKFPT